MASKEQEKEERIVIKVIVLGCANVGKTSLMKRYCTNKFSKERKVTTGTDFASKRIRLNDKSVQLQLWDTAGQERFHHGTLGGAFYRGADGAVIVYDVTSNVSFEQVEHWRSELLSRLDTDPEDFPVIVIGNKMDMLAGMEHNEDDRNWIGSSFGGTVPDYPVDHEAVLDWCNDYGLGHIDTSALDGTGVATAMETIASLAISQQLIRKKRDAKPESIRNKKIDLRKSVDPAELYQKRSKCASCGGEAPKKQTDRTSSVFDKR